jgi:hypothetical protein
MAPSYGEGFVKTLAFRALLHTGVRHFSLVV